MSLFKRAAPIPEEPVLTPKQLAIKQEEDRLAALAEQRGDQFCSGRGCKEETGLACSFVDRRERPCPTAWCVEHRVITHGAIYCPTHAGLVDGTTNQFGTTASTDIDNRVPALVNWVTREVDSDVRVLAERIAVNLDEEVVAEPVRFILFGVERIRTWERSWKTCSRFGVDLRVAVAVEEKHPDVVLCKCNSKVVLSLPPPWNEEYQVGPKPESEAAEEQALVEFHHKLVFALGSAADDWYQQENDRKLRGEDSGEARYHPG